MKITVLGSGRWASNLIGLCLKNGHNVKCYEKEFENVPESEFFKFGRNNYIDLSDYLKNGELTFTHDIEEAIGFSEYIIISILSQKLDEFMQEVSQVKSYNQKKYCLAMKGVEASTGRTLSEILMHNGVTKDNIVVIAGPGHVQSISAGKKTHMVAVGYSKLLTQEFIQILSNNSFLLFPYSDVKGVEICAAVKNIYGALAGICVGSNNPTLRGSLMCASLAEMEKVLETMQCSPKTARRLPLLGDFDATMYDTNSHNLNYGIEIIKQNTINPKLSFNSVEGRFAVNGMVKRIADHNAQMSDEMQIKAPLIETYQKLINGEIEIEHIVEKIEEAIKAIYEVD